jgi:O-antigen/teichoic acid export membrane protein
MFGAIFVGGAISIALFTALPVELRAFGVVTSAWSMLILFFDTTLVILNAENKSAAYARLSFMRGVLIVLLSTGLAAAGFGVWGAVAGSLAATALATIAHRGALVAWRRLDVKPPAPIEWIQALRFGLAGVLVLNIYIVVNAVVRNFVALAIGPEQAGYASLAADLFYAPIALFSAAISLSKIPHLFREAEADLSSGSGHDRELLLANIATSLPYMAGGAIVAVPLAGLLLDADTVRGVASIGPFAAIQGGCFALIATQTTIGLTRGKVKYAVLFSLAAVASVAVGLGLASPFDSLESYAFATTLALAAVAILILVTSSACLDNPVPVRELMKVTLSTAAMVTVMGLVDTTANPLMVLLSIFVGGATYVAVGLAISSQSIRQILRLSRR